MRGFVPLTIILAVGIFVLAGGAFLLFKDGSNPKLSVQFTQEKLDISSGVAKTGSKYKSVTTKPTGWFTTGQAADIMLSGIGFNDSGGPLLFNHPGNIASDGNSLLLADRNNNRVLIWNKLPTGNIPPDLVLGQKDFTGNNGGTDTASLNWPVGVAAAKGKVVVADTYNDRVLIWNSFPSKNGQGADIVIEDDRLNPKRNVGWPWAVWTNGEKLIVTATNGSRVLIWNSFPTQNNQEADVVLTANNNFGTPRSIASDGRHLMVGDHNVRLVAGRPGNFFWKTFPTQNDQKYDFFVSDAFFVGDGGSKENRPQGGDVIWGSMSKDGKLIGMTNMLHIWNLFPENEDDGSDLNVGGTPGNKGYDFGGGQSGDGSGAVIAGDKLYLSLYNGNKVVGFNNLPTRPDQKPDFAIGAPDINTNTLETNFMLTNPVLATDGQSLFAGATFGRLYFYVWKDLPDESGAKPDFVYDLGFPPRSITTHKNMLFVVGDQKLAVWNKIPLSGEAPDTIYQDKIGNVAFNNVGAIAFDDKYFYLTGMDKIYVWEGFPARGESPKFSFDTQGKVKSLSSDGKYLAVSSGERALSLYKVDELSSSPRPIQIGQGNFNLPTEMLIRQGGLFVADTVFNRVQVWNKVEDAIAGRKADVILGQTSMENPNRPLLSNSGLFWPARLAFDGSYLWVGEFKFSGRILRFSVR